MAQIYCHTPQGYLRPPASLDCEAQLTGSSAQKILQTLLLKGLFDFT